MQTLSPTISPTIAKKISAKATDADVNYLSAIAPSIAHSSVLQTALAGLDASLNDELDRYRHWQDNGQTISYLNPFRPRAISSQSVWTSSSSLAETLSPIASPIESIANSERRTIQMPVMPPLTASASNSSASNSISASELSQYQGLDVGNSLESNSSFAENLPYAETAKGFDSPPMAKVPQPDDDDILQSFANDYANYYSDQQQQEIGDYQIPIPSAPPEEKGALRSLLNPVGIISLLLLLLSSAAIGYLMVDPSGVMKLFKPEQRPKAAQSEGSHEDLGKDINLQNQQKVNDSALSFVPFAGDKTQSNSSANKSLTNSAIDTKIPSTKSSSLFATSSSSLNAPLRTVPSTSLPSLSVAPLPQALAPSERSYNSPARRSYETPVAAAYSEPRSNRSTSSSTPSRPSAVNSPSAATTTYVAPRTSEYNAPRNSAAVKYAAPLSANPTPANPASNPAQSSSYRVVVENSYAASAQQVQQDAYVRPSDGQVQMGSYRDANAAQQRIEQLRRQGIPAKIE